MKLYRISFMALLLSTLLSACASAPMTRTPVKMDAILQQINSAITAANDMKDKSAPQITSVQLDLQLGVSTAADASGPLGLLVLGGNVSQEETHSVSLVFVPSASARAPSSVADGSLTELATAIRAIYHAVPNGGPNFKFQNGSVKIQCVFKTEVDGGIDSTLIPVEFQVSKTGQRTQTITFNFGSAESVASGAKVPDVVPASAPNLTTSSSPKLPGSGSSSSAATSSSTSSGGPGSKPSSKDADPARPN